MRDRFLKGGLEGFHDYEIIELLLTLGTPRKDCKSAAKSALKSFGSLRGVLEASPEELWQIEGIGPNNVFGLKVAQAVARRYLADRVLDSDFIRSSDEVMEYLQHNLRDRGREVFIVIIFAHNHPSGSPTPSADDHAITKKLKEATAAIDVSVHDHIIIAGNEVYSLADHGLL